MPRQGASQLGEQPHSVQLLRRLLRESGRWLFPRLARERSGHISSPVGSVVYRFELRRADEILATGYLSPEEPFEVGDSVTIGRRLGIVRAIEPLLNEPALRLVVQVLRDP